MRARVILYGTIFSALCLSENVQSVFLTTTLITGFMGGFLIGRLNLGTFLTLLAANRTSSPLLNLPSILPSLLIPREEDAPKNGNSAIPTEASQPQSYTTARSTIVEQQYAYEYNELQKKRLPVTYQSMDVPVSLDNKIRDRFLRQLALMDPLNCLPKIFCEVSADPLGAALAIKYFGYISIDKGTIAAIHPIQQPSITSEELVAYQNHVMASHQMQQTTTKPPPTLQQDVVNDQEFDNDQEDNNSGSDEDNRSDSEEGRSDEEDDDDSFEQYRKEHEHKLQMQAFEEMIEDDVEDPLTYSYILMDKKEMKEKRKKEKNRRENKERQDLMNYENPMMSMPMGYDDGAPLLVNRRVGYGGPHLPPPPLQPPVFRPPQTTEDSIDDMFADDPFFSGFSSSRRKRDLLDNVEEYTRDEAISKDDLMKKFRVAFLVAEKFRSPGMCSIAFTSCPYQTKTIMHVVNRLQSGLLPFGSEKKVNTKQNSKNGNLLQFQNTLFAIESLNNATLQAKQRGEKIDIDRVADEASRPTTEMGDANTSSYKIVKEFQEVAKKIGKGKGKRKKKPKKKYGSKGHKKKFDVEHYAKKAQIHTKLLLKTTKKKLGGTEQVDDEVVISQGTKGVRVPTFHQTYAEMFKVSKVKSRRPRPPNQPKTTTAALKNKENSFSQNTTISSLTSAKPIKKFSITTEDDEQDAKESENAVNALISKQKPNRSPIL